MTSDSPLDDEITTTEEFEAVLGDLLDVALQNDIDPRGSWEYRSNGSHTDWEVMVVELQERDSSE